MGATNQPIFSFQPTRPVLIYVKFKKMTGGNVRSMKQVIHVIGAAIFDRCADVVASPKSQKRHRKMRQKQERDLTGHYGAILLRAVVGALEHQRGLAQTNKPRERRRREH
jgi:hypothetical protein